MENDRLRKSGFHVKDLYQRIISTENLFAAWREFKHGKTGKKDVLVFAQEAEKHIVALHDDLVRGIYQHGEYSRFFVQDPKQRPIAKASVRDRVLHHAICRVLSPLFDKVFIFDSYASRKTKGTHVANARLREFARRISRNGSRPVWLLKCDIRKFFDSVDHTILLRICRERIADPQLMDLLVKIVVSFETRPGKGIPLGNLTSQLLANVYMDQFDQHVKRVLRHPWYIRYTDDFALLSPDKHKLEVLLPRMQLFLREALELEVHPRKVSYRQWHQGVDFLGYVHFAHHKIVRPSTKRRMIRKITALRDEAGEDDAKRISFEQAKQSYLGILSHARSRGAARKIRRDFRVIGTNPA